MFRNDRQNDGRRFDGASLMPQEKPLPARTARTERLGEARPLEAKPRVERMMTDFEED